MTTERKTTELDGPPPQWRDRYLGDGLYGSFDGFQFRLAADRFGIVHEVFLEPAVASAFIDFVREIARTKVDALGGTDEQA